MERVERGRAAAWARLDAGQLGPALLCLLAFLVALISPMRQPERSDPWGALLTAQALIEHGTVALAVYPEAATALEYRVNRGSPLRYYNFPIGTSLAAIPFVWAANRLGLDMARPADDGALQNLLSALSSAAVALCCYGLARRLVGPRAAVVLAASLVFGTGLISTLGSALWSLNLATLLLLCCLLVLTRPPAGDGVGRGLLIGALLAAAYLCRPTVASFAAPLLLYCLLLRRRTFVGLAIAGATAALLFAGFALAQYGEPVPPYYRAGRLSQPDPALFIVALLGHLVSPGRGALVWSPQLLLVLGGALALLPRLRREPLYWLALAWLGLHLLAISSFPHWWGGISFGNRLVVDALPAALLLAALAWRAVGPGLTLRARRLVAGAFVALSLPALLIHSVQGLFNPYGYDWHYLGEAQIDSFPAMLFDWRYPPFLAGEAQFAARTEAYMADPLRPNELFGRPVWPMRHVSGLPGWSPRGLTLAPGLSALFGLGWHSYEEPGGIRWMRASSRLWVVSERGEPALLRLRPAIMNQGGAPGDRGRLAIWLNGALVEEADIAWAAPLERPLALRPGLNELRLELAGGEAQLAPGDPRKLGVSFSEIALLGP